MSRPGKSLRSSGRTRDLLNHKGVSGKGSGDRTFNCKQYANNRAAIVGLSQKAVGFHKSYGSPTGAGGKPGRPDRAQIDRSKKAWRNYQSEYEMLQRDCDAINREAGVDSSGNIL